MEGIIKADNTLLLKLEKKGDLYTAYLKWHLIIYGLQTVD